MEKLRVLLLVWVGLVFGVRHSHLEPKVPHAGGTECLWVGSLSGAEARGAEKGSPARMGKEDVPTCLARSGPATSAPSGTCGGGAQP